MISSRGIELEMRVKCQFLFKSSFLKILSWLVFLTIPLTLTCLRLKELGFFSKPLVGVGGWDFYPGAMMARLLIDYPGGIPPILPEFAFPEGVQKAELPEFFAEPLWSYWLKVILYFKPDPLWALWFGMVTSTVFNIWGCLALLGWRFRKNLSSSESGLSFKADSKLAVLLGWSLLAFSPWIWGRTTVHWTLSWVPFFLFCTLIWWDFFVHDKKPNPLMVVVSHFLLLSQSIYYGFFFILLILLWFLTASRRVIQDKPFRQAGWMVILCATLGFALETLCAVHHLGGLTALKSKTAQIVERPARELHVYSSRMRELTRGGPHSLWNYFAVWCLKQRTDRPSQDGEGFPAPLPKLVLFVNLLVILALLLPILKFKSFQKKKIFRKEKLDGTNRPEGVNDQDDRESKLSRGMCFALIGIFGFFLIGLQETPWIKRWVLYPIAPFIRSYARILMPVLCISAIWVTDVFWQFFSRVRNPLLPFAISLIWGVLLFVDYGWPQKVMAMQTEIPCSKIYERIKAQKLPVFLQLIQSSCPLREFDVYAIAGVPLLSRPWNSLNQSLIPGTELCLNWKEKIAQATKITGQVTWWFEGSQEDLHNTLKCLHPQFFEKIWKAPSEANQPSKRTNAFLAKIR